MSDEQRLGKCCPGWENEDGFPAPCYDCLKAEVERLRTEVNALRRWAKTAKNAFHDAMECLHYEKHEGLPAHKALHPDDWKRLKNWIGELKSAREAAEKVRNCRESCGSG